MNDEEQDENSQDEDEQEFVEVNVKFPDDEALYFDLEPIPEDERPDRVLSFARLGHLVAGMATVQPGEDAMKVFFRPYTDEMVRLDETLKEHLTTFQSKSMGEIGNIGENFVGSNLQTVYGKRGDTFQIKGQEAHATDIWGFFTRDGLPPGKVLIEVKNYSGDVPGNQVTKFKRDIKEHKADISAAMFVSLNTKIQNISTLGTPLYIDVVEGIPTFYITQGAPGQMMFLPIWGMLTEMLGQADRKTGVSGSVSKITLASTVRLRSFIQDFNQDVNDELAQIRGLKDKANTIVSTAHEIRDDASQLEVNLQGRAKEFRRFIEAETLGLSAGSAPELPTIHISESEWAEKWSEINQKSQKQNQANLVQLYTWLHYVDELEPEWTESELKLSQDGSLICTVSLLSNGIRFAVNKEAYADAGAEFTWEDKEKGWVKANSGKSASIPSDIIKPFFSQPDEVSDDGEEDEDSSE
ncbi:MAG: hypothetical protein HOE69_08535 [Euryarchaeota archaeon]|jgi:hypothetical protein|nr:hypothetical protein [Euryarchaeota archaeon]